MINRLTSLRHLLLLCCGLMSMMFGFRAQAADDSSVTQLLEQCQSLEDSQPQQAIELAQTIIDQIDPLNNPINYGLTLGCLGWSYAVLEQFDESRQTAVKLEKLAHGLNETEYKVNLQRRAGSIFHRLGDRIDATENYQTAMLVAEKLGLEKEQIPLLVNLGVLNSEIRAHQKAIDNYYLALELMEKNDDYRYQAPVLFNLAVTLNGQDRHQEALDTYRQVESLINEQWPTQRVIQVYFGLAIAHSGLEQKEQTQLYINKIEALQQEETEPGMFTHGFAVFKALQEIKNGRSEGALEVADAAAAFYFSEDSQQLLTSANNPLDLLATLYEELKEPEAALKIHKAARTLEQQFQNSFNRKTMAQMQARLDNVQQNEELAMLKVQNQQHEMDLNKTFYQRSLMLVSIGFLVVILLIILFWQLHSKRQLIKLTTTDPLTDIKNRRGIAMWHQSHHWPSEDAERYLWLIDIDNFRKLNDEIGHDVGDTALRSLAESLKTFETQDRCLGRWGGEEFLLLTQDLKQSQLQGFADQLLSAIATTEIVHGIHEFNLQASIGVSFIKDKSDHMWNRAVSQADKALYVAKERGRNCMVLATEF